MTPEELPTEARRKLLAIESARQDAEDAAHAAGRRLQQLDPRSTDPAVVQAGEQLMEKRDRHSQRHDELNVLVNKIRAWLRELPPGTILEPALPSRSKPNKEETIGQAIVRIRGDILKTKQNLIATRDAPMPTVEVKRLIANRVQKMAWPPNLDVTAGKLTLWFTNPQAADSRCELNEVAALLAWLFPEELTARLHEEVDNLDEPENPLTRAEKEKRMDELRGRLNELECAEESLVDEAGREQNLEIARRADASPACVLGVVIKTAAAAQAQAAAA